MTQSHAHPTEIGKYKILSVLGRGGMGTVYRALDPVIDRTVAVKTISIQQEGIDASQVERLLMEARSAGRLHHNNIVTVFDFGQAADTAYIVLELVEGVDLGQIISSDQPLALPQKIDLILQICQGLGYAHDRGVTHRDMKPSNVRVTADGTAKILDFGLARFDDTQLTKSGFISGTIAYMSPERINGQTGMSDDIFALGASAYELLTYRRAFPGATTPEVMFKILTEAPPAPSTIAELPMALDAVILKSVSREAKDRYASAHDFAAALEEAFESDAAQQFVMDPARSDAFKTALRNWTPRRRTRDTRARTMVPPPTQSGDTPTQVISSDPALLGRATSVDRSPSAGAMTVTDLPADKTVVSHPMAAPATQLVQKPRSKFALAAVLVVVVGAAAAAGLLLTGGGDSELPKTTSTVTTSNPTTASASMAPVADTSLVVTPQGTMGTVGTMLNAPVPPPLDTAGAPATDTKKKPKPAPPTRPIEPQPRPQPPTPVPQPQPTPQPRDDTPVPAPQPPPQPAPQPQPQPVPQPAPDAREEITAFMRRVARAYESHDSGFFRENHLGYSDAMGNAVRNSPSMRVRLDIVSITLSSPNQARVIADRTDELTGASAPAKQRLAFVLERDGSEWKIRRFERP